MESKPNFLIPTNIESPSVSPFWEGLKKGKFSAPRCRDCSEIFFPPRSHCPKCLGNVFAWEALSGKGYLHSWTEMFFAQPEFELPFLLGLVDLAEGIGRITARISGSRPEELSIGMPLQIKISEQINGLAIYYVEPLGRE